MLSSPDQKVDPTDGGTQCIGRYHEVEQVVNVVQVGQERSWEVASIRRPCGHCTVVDRKVNIKYEGREKSGGICLKLSFKPGVG